MNAALNSTFNCQRTIHTCDLLHCSLLLFCSKICQSATSLLGCCCGVSIIPSWSSSLSRTEQRPRTTPPLFFSRGSGMQGLDGEESDHRTRHESPDQPIGKLVCNSQVSASRGQSLCTFITEHVKFN